MIEILQYTVYTSIIFPGFLTLNQFAWKPQLIRFIFEHSDVKNVFWIDSGNMAFGNKGFSFEHIKRYGYWLREEERWTNYNFKHGQCKEILNVTEKEIEGNQLLAGLTGFNVYLQTKDQMFQMNGVFFVLLKNVLLE